jgi:hypothetical protein
MFACGSEAENKAAPPPPQNNLGDGTPKEDPPAADVCAEATGQYTATREPSNVLFLYDRSGSMHIKLPTNATRWEATKAGFFDLLSTLPPSTGAGLMLFPQGDTPVNSYCRIDSTSNDVDCDDGWPEPSGAARCAADSYKANVPSGLLNPAQVTAMKNEVTASDASFYWGTPLSTALTAAIAAQRASTLPGAKSVILLTDGNPTSCSDSGITNDISHVVDAAASGLQGTLVRTFVIGLVDSARQAAKAENLSPIAVAGGTKRTAGCEADNSCFYKLTDANFTADLEQVFKEISTQAFDCTFNLPPQTAGTDPSLITVQLAKGGSSQPVAQDATHANGWDYLPNGTQIQLYGQACTDMKDENASLRIVLGCKPPPPPPPPEKETR